MKTTEPRFILPNCVFEDALPYAAFYLLCYLWSVSSVDGHCAPGYDKMLHAMSTRCRNTITRNLNILRKRGWFHYCKRKGNQNKAFQLCIPARYQTKKKIKTNVIAEFNPQYGRIG